MLFEIVEIFPLDELLKSGPSELPRDMSVKLRCEEGPTLEGGFTSRDAFFESYIFLNLLRIKLTYGKPKVINNKDIC